QNLDAGNNGGLKSFDLRRHRNLLQHAVNPVADAQLVLKRLQMNVRSAQFDGVGEDLVDKFDDGGVLGRVFEVGVLLPGFIDHLQRRDVVEGVNRIGADAEVPFYFAPDRFGRGENRFDSQAGQRLERVQ